MADPNTLDRYQALAERVDRKFAAIQRRNAGSMRCGSGCSDCCRARLSVTHVEEAHMRRGLARLPDELRRELAESASAERQEMCPALDDQGRCRIYELRPLICRSFGVPLRHRRPLALIHPPIVDVCDKNFTGSALKLVSDEDTLEQTELVDALTTIDRDHCRRQGLADVVRIPIAQILATCAPSD